MPLEHGKPVDIIDAKHYKQNKSVYHIALPADYVSTQLFVSVLEIDKNTYEKDMYQQI